MQWTSQKVFFWKFYWSINNSPGLVAVTENLFHATLFAQRAIAWCDFCGNRLNVYFFIEKSNLFLRLEFTFQSNPIDNWMLEGQLLKIIKIIELAPAAVDVWWFSVDHDHDPKNQMKSCLSTQISKNTFFGDTLWDIRDLSAIATNSKSIFN